jgi:poly-gamma-glutamate synthesis protein (capsule biosynthesis protein)
MYFVTLAADGGALARLTMAPMRARHFRLQRASGEEARWLGARLAREGASLGTKVEVGPDGTLSLRWATD